jgi:Transcriptional regulatory protein, C terminal
LRGDVVLPLGSRALDILVYLANRPGEVIKKKELIDYVWSDVFVEEVALGARVLHPQGARGWPIRQPIHRKHLWKGLLVRRRRRPSRR